MINEIWRPAHGCPGYSVSNMGRFRAEERTGMNQYGPTVVAQRMHKTSINPRGYRTVSVNIDGKVRTHALHLIVMRTFVGDAPPGMEVCHNDGDPSNAALSNLRYDTHSGNMLDRKKHGTELVRRGEDHHKAKLTWRAVREIRSANKSTYQLAREYGVTQGAIWNCIAGNTWKEPTQ